MGAVDDGAGGGLVDAAALHADQAILDQVYAPDGVLAAQPVQRLENLYCAHVLPVQAGWRALFKTDFNVDCFVRRQLRIAR